MGAEKPRVEAGFPTPTAEALETMPVRDVQPPHLVLTHRPHRSSRPQVCILVSALVAFAGVALPARQAHAQRYYDDRYDERDRSRLALAFDLEGAVPVNIPQVNGNSLNGGGGFKVRVGGQFRAPWMRFTPELGYGYDHLFASDYQGDAYAWDLHRVFGGARIDFGHFLVPVIYGHLGYGWRATGDPNVPSTGGLAYDLGGALDLHVVPHLSFGAHVEFDGIESQPDTPQWLALGGHLSLVF
jgi:hypothetical protein